MLYSKHPNSASKHPCPYCMVKQEGHDGGDLGNRRYDIKGNRRTRAQFLRSRQALADLAHRPTKQTDRSIVLGVTAPHPSVPVWPLYDLLDFDPVAGTPVERLHADALVRPIVR